MERYNFYDILEVHPHSNSHEITAAYERLKLTYSGEDPAVYSIFTDQEVREYLKLIEEAYSILNNKSSRSLYDERLGKKSVEQTSKTEKPSSNLYKVDENLEKEFQTITEWDGEQLRRVREYRHIGYDQLSQITKISCYYLQALEEMNIRNLPAPVFVRGYVIQVAKVFGLSEKKVADSYMRRFKTGASEKSA